MEFIQAAVRKGRPDSRRQTAVRTAVLTSVPEGAVGDFDTAVRPGRAVWTAVRTDVPTSRKGRPKL